MQTELSNVRLGTVKKEMRISQTLVGEDLNADNLLSPALELANYWVVAKHRSCAESIFNKKPSTSIKMKKNRFDFDVNRAIPQN